MTTLLNNRDGIEKRLRLAAWLLVIAFGLIQAWSTRYNIEPDGISYLDIADKYIQGDWTNAVNAYWSPLYSWVLAVAFSIFRPSSYWEYPLVHLVNFLIYMCAFACFEFLICQIVAYQRQTDPQRAGLSLSSWCWQSIGYVLFVWCALFLITISVVTPDMAVAALLFLLSGLLIRIKLRPEKWGLYVCFGVALGLAYLTKAVMFPLSFVFLLTCFVWVRNRRLAWPRVLLAAVVFLLVSTPFILALHHAKGRWMFSGTGKLAYAWFINGVEPSIHWQGSNPPNFGVPAHTTSKIFAEPAVYEFKEPFAVTYPPWYDPTYWYEGVVTRFDLKGHVKVFSEVVFYFYAVFINSPIGNAVLLSFLVLTFFTWSSVRAWLAELSLWSILLPPLASFILYSLVHMETRYIGGFAALFWLGLFSSVRFANIENARRLQKAVAIALVAATMIVLIAKSIVPTLTILREITPGHEVASADRWRVANGLATLGLARGDQIGAIGYGFGSIQYSARLAKLRIIAEISPGSDFNPKSDVDKFWHSSPDVQQQVIEAFRKTGAKAIVANRLPPGLAYPPGWQRVGDTEAYVYFLR